MMEFEDNKEKTLNAFLDELVKSDKKEEKRKATDYGHAIHKEIVERSK